MAESLPLAPAVISADELEDLEDALAVAEARLRERGASRGGFLTPR